MFTTDFFEERTGKCELEYYSQYMHESKYCIVGAQTVRYSAAGKIDMEYHVVSL